MAKKKGGNAFSVSVDGLSKLGALPGFIDDAQGELLNKAARRIGDEVRKKAPGGPMGKAARDVEARALTSTTAVVRSRGWKGARILERGGSIRPKKGEALRFSVDGKTVFTRGPVHIKGRGYWRKGLRARGKIVRQTYHEAFGSLGRGA